MRIYYNYICLSSCCGGAVASWLVPLPMDQGVKVWTHPSRPGWQHCVAFLGMTLYSAASNQEILCWGIIQQWTCIPSRGSRNNTTGSQFMLLKSETSVTWTGHLAFMQILLLPLILQRIIYHSLPCSWMQTLTYHTTQFWRCTTMLWEEQDALWDKECFSSLFRSHP